MNFQIETLTESVLREHYVEQGLSDRAIGLLYGRSSVWVCKLRAHYGITLPQGRRNYPKVRPTTTSRVYKGPPLIGQLLELFLGSMLGDGYLSKDLTLVEGHCEAQKPYLEWKRGLWGELARSSLGHTDQEKVRARLDRSFPERVSTAQGVWVMRTRKHPDFERWRTLFYPTGKAPKTFPIEVVEHVTPFMLAVWYGDDGTATRWPTFCCHQRNHAVALQVLAKAGFAGSPNGHSIDIRGHEQASRLVATIQPHLHECVQYKLDYTCERGNPYAQHADLTPELLSALCAQGKTVQQMVRMTGVGSKVIRDRLLEQGLKAPKLVAVEADAQGSVTKVPRNGKVGRSLKQFPTEELLRMASEGLSVRKIGLRFGCHYRVIQRALSELGVVLEDGRKTRCAGVKG